MVITNLLKTGKLYRLHDGVLGKTRIIVPIKQENDGWIKVKEIRHDLPISKAEIEATPICERSLADMGVISYDFNKWNPSHWLEDISTGKRVRIYKKGERIANLFFPERSSGRVYHRPISITYRKPRLVNYKDVRRRKQKEELNKAVKEAIEKVIGKEVFLIREEDI